MGGCGSSPKDQSGERTGLSKKNQRNINAQIDSGLRDYVSKDKRENKLLLLGTGGSGKSTLFKGLRLINGEQFEQREQQDTRHVIRSNLVAGMLTLLQKSSILYEKDPDGLFSGCHVNLEDESIVAMIQTVVGFAEESFTDDDLMDRDQLKGLGDALATLWALPAIQETFRLRGGRFSFPDNLEWYFDKVQKIMELDYFPDNEDFLKARIRTTGVTTMVYESDDNVFKIFDVGGQRNERKKWIHSFDSVAAVLFVTALNHYNAVLFEDESRNAMHESLELFKEICNSKWFRNSELILFLNKSDLFTIDIAAGNSLSVCFTKNSGWFGDQWGGPDYEPRDDIALEEDPDFVVCYSAAVEFIQNQFLKLNDVPDKAIFQHVTCGTDTSVVKKVFWDVQNVVIRANLKRGGLMV